MAGRKRVTTDPEIYDTIMYTSSWGDPWNSLPRLVKDGQRLCVDTVTPGFFQKIRRGEIINNPCLIQHDSREQLGLAVLHRTHKTAGSWFTMVGPLTAQCMEVYGSPALPDVTLLPLADAVGIAKAKALANVDSAWSAFGEDALELRETLQFLANPLKSVCGVGKEFQRLLRQRKTANIGQLADAAASLWLEYRFALSPLVNSIDQAMKVALRRESVLTERRSVHGTSFSEGKTSANAIQNTSDGNAITWKQEVEKEQLVRAYIIYEVTNPVDDWKTRYGFRWKDWPKTLWNIMPLSFMVDRLIDLSTTVGGLMNFLDPSIKLLAAGYTSKLNVQTTETVVAFEKPSTWSTALSSDNGFVTKRGNYQRYMWNPTIWDIVPPPQLGGLVSDITKVTDLAALAVQRWTFRVPSM